MDVGKIKSIVVEVLQAVQESSGEAYTNLASDDKPIGMLAGFDSLTGIEATVMIEEKLNCEVGRPSVFVSEKDDHALTLAEICEHLEQIIDSETRAAA
ncbi:MAG: hypothetical protein OXJ38_05595 [Gammaproteobacteria bacterium]|nr:hypothetical protein [Gammaproteobacteria bacterium]